LIEAAQKPVPGLEHVLYNAQHGFTLQNLLLLAPLKPEDGDAVVDQKLGLVARYIDTLLTWRLWNFRTIAYSTMQYSMAQIVFGIRGLSVEALSKKLHESLVIEGNAWQRNGHGRRLVFIP
jgi:hypothetical protein